MQVKTHPARTLAGWGINPQLENTIYPEMLRYRRRPSKMFTGSAQRVQSLMAMLSYGAGTGQ